MLISEIKLIKFLKSGISFFQVQAREQVDYIAREYPQRTWAKGGLFIEVFISMSGLWDQLLKTRIELQKVGLLVNQLPHPEMWDLFKKQGGDDYYTALHKGQPEAISQIDNSHTGVEMSHRSRLKSKLFEALCERNMRMFKGIVHENRK